MNKVEEVVLERETNGVELIGGPRLSSRAKSTNVARLLSRNSSLGQSAHLAGKYRITQQ